MQARSCGLCHFFDGTLPGLGEGFRTVVVMHRRTALTVTGAIALTLAAGSAAMAANLGILHGGDGVDVGDLSPVGNSSDVSTPATTDDTTPATAGTVPATTDTVPDVTAPATTPDTTAGTTPNTAGTTPGRVDDHGGDDGADHSGPGRGGDTDDDHRGSGRSGDDDDDRHDDDDGDDGDDGDDRGHGGGDDGHDDDD